MGGYVSRSGSPGVDHSANAATVPLAGYSSTPVLQIPANPRRNFVEIQNQSELLLQMVRDDGNNGNVTTILLMPASTSPGAGQNWTSDTFHGRITIYGPNGQSPQVGGYED